MIYKILYVIDNLEFGGGERGFLQIIEALDKNKFFISVAAHPGGIFEKKIVELDIPFYPINFANRYSISSILKLRNVIDKKKFDIIHSQGARADFFSRISARIPDKPCLISTVQMPVDGFNVGMLRRGIYRLIEKFSEKSVDCFIVVSDGLIDILKNHHNISENKIYKVFNGIETRLYNSEQKSDCSKNIIRRSFGISNTEFVIGAIGRFCWQKGFEYLIRSLPDVLLKYPDVKVLLVGDGPLRKTIKDLTKFLSIEKNVIFTGFRNDIKDILSSMDIIVVPSLVEGFPMIILEAMAMEKPIVATRIDGITEQLKDEKEGILIPPRNPLSIATAIFKIKENSGFANKIGRAAGKKVKKYFSVNRMIKETENIYISLITQNK
jgi:glycosyltransferase involved in cell wall biosynthesis